MQIMRRFLYDIDNDDDDDSLDGWLERRVFKWLETSVHSPVKIKDGNISEIRIADKTVVYLYEMNIKTDLEIPNDINIASSSIKTCPYTFGGVDRKMQKDENDFIESLNKVKTITIFGHNKDCENEFSTRFDEDFYNRLKKTPLDKPNLNCIMLHGSFESVDMMNKIIDRLYDNYLEKSFDSCIKVYLDSYVRDDNGVDRCLAEMIMNSYVKPSVVDRDNVVIYEYKRFDRNMSSQFFTKELEINTNKNLFERNDLK